MSRRQYVSSRRERRGLSCLPLVVLIGIALVLGGGFTLWRQIDRSVPAVTITPGAKAVGRTFKMTAEAAEPRHGLRSLRAVLVQEGHEIPLGEKSQPGTPWWRLRRTPAPSPMRLEVEATREQLAGLKEGRATLRAEAVNDSPAGFGRGRTGRAELELPVLLTPPRVEVISSVHYINQGGSECVHYRVSDSAETSGVRAGGYFFRGHAKPGGGSGERFALFAFPHDLPPTTVPVVVATDAAGNETIASFPFRLFPKRYREATIELDDAFFGRVVPAILSHTPELKSEGDLLKDFLQINGRLRRENAAALVELSGRSKEEFLWHGAFRPLGGSAVMASFADRRSYRYGGRIVDHQDHLGFDLAATAHFPIAAGNDGIVVLAKWFGIYGNTVVIDHGYGLQSLYSHLSSIDVTEGQTVRRGDTLGHSGTTGLAAGDHLHFSILLQGVPVDPREWWDAHWIHDRIEPKTGPRL